MTKNVRLKTVTKQSVRKGCAGMRPTVNLEDVLGGEGRLQGEALVTTEARDNLAFESGDVLFSKLRPYLAKSLLVDRPMFGSPEFLVMRPEPALDNRFLLHLSLSSVWLDWATATSYGTMMPRTSWQDMAEFRLDLPALAEQRRIADFLDDQVAVLQAARDLRQKQIALGDERQTSSRRSLIMDCGAPLVPLKYLAVMGTGHTPSRDHPDYWINCTVPWVSAADISQRRFGVFEPLTDTELKISEIGLANSSAVLHPVDTVMLCRTASVGLVTIVGRPMATSQRFVTWTPGGRLVPRYLLYTLDAMKPDLLNLANGSTHGTIYMPDLEALRVPLPSYARQLEIVQQLDSLVVRDDHIGALFYRSASLFNERKQALITAAVTGQFDVTTAKSVA